jgi:site-specific recombinase XerD
MADALPVPGGTLDVLDRAEQRLVRWTRPTRKTPPVVVSPATVSPLAPAKKNGGPRSGPPAGREVRGRPEGTATRTRSQALDARDAYRARDVALAKITKVTPEVVEIDATLAEVVASDSTQNPAAVYLARLGSAKSRRAMRGALLRVLRAVGVVPAGVRGKAATRAVVDHVWSTWGYAEVTAARAALVAAGGAPASTNQALAALRGVLKEAFLLGQIAGEEWARLEQVKGVKSTRLAAGRCLPPEEVSLMLDAARAGGTHAARDVALLAMLRLGGCRLAEVAQLQLERVDLVRGEARVIGKGDKERIIYFADALEEVRAWVALRGSDPGPIFYSFSPAHEGRLRPLSESGVYYVVKALAEKAGVKMTTHDFRRTFITELLDSGADVVAVSKLAGHAQVTTTAAYDRRPEERLRSVAAGVKLPRSKG